MPFITPAQVPLFGKTARGRHVGTAVVGCVVALVASLVAITPAQAGPRNLSDAFAAKSRHVEIDMTPRLQDDAPTGDALPVQEGSSGRNSDMELGFRGRYLWIPDAFIDIWFADDDVAGYVYSEPRPGIQAYAAGLEFVIKNKVEEEGNGGSNGIFYVQYIDSLMKEGYWDDSDDFRDDGDFIAPTDNLGMLAIGADYAYEVHMVKTMDTNGNFGMSMLVGGGVFFGYVFGDLPFWRPEGTKLSFERWQDGDPDNGSKLPGFRVLPMIDINLGFRFNFGDRFVMRVESGFQGMFYAGGSMGLMF
ncbi:MAG: hypothetical protein AB8H79_25750 [Myxococcota bacterium]